MSLTQAVKAEAYKLGFAFAGVTTPEPPGSFSNYSRWIEAGYQGEMSYLAADRSLQRRADPYQILTDCKSILVLGMRYHKPTGAPLTADDTLQRRVAAYAWGADYHDVIPERLTRLIAFMEKELGNPIPNRVYTDTGPVLERDLGQRAGLGWIGKNSMLINPRSGSYFFLAEVLLGIDLEIDQPFTSDHCGTCTRCIQACPTDCILPERTIDATRCISYLTIELKGPIPIPLRSKMGSLIFGCDICQQVCPWNLRFAPLEGDVQFSPRPNLTDVFLHNELAIRPEEFNKKFKGSPIKRAKRRGYLRNVAIALGNSANLAATPHLAKALGTDPEVMVRGHAAWALGNIGDTESQIALSKAEDRETDAWVLEEINAALSLC